MTEGEKKVLDDIREIIETCNEQEASGCYDTPGGVEHVGDFISLMFKYERWLKG